MTHKNRKKQGNFMFIFEGLKGSHDVLFVGLGISKLQMYCIPGTRFKFSEYIHSDLTRVKICTATV